MTSHAAAKVIEMYLSVQTGKNKNVFFLEWDTILPPASFDIHHWKLSAQLW